MHQLTAFTWRIPEQDCGTPGCQCWCTACSTIRKTPAARSSNPVGTAHGQRQALLLSSLVGKPYPSAVAAMVASRKWRAEFPLRWSSRRVYSAELHTTEEGLDLWHQHPRCICALRCILHVPRIACRPGRWRHPPTRAAAAVLPPPFPFSRLPGHGRASPWSVA